jgi:hypothetical protein
MTSLETVLASRNASLSEMVALLQRQHDAKLDVVVPRAICASTAVICTSGDRRAHHHDRPRPYPNDLRQVLVVFHTCDCPLKTQLSCFRQQRYRTRLECLDRIDTLLGCSGRLLFRRCNGVHITAPTHETIVFFRDTRLTCSSAGPSFS